MRILLLITFLLIQSSLLIAQIPYNIEGTVVNNTETGTWYGVNIPRNEPTKLIYRKNSITSVNSEGYLLQAGDENPSPRDNNLDNQEIIGNLFNWKGTNEPSIITHGLFTGYNINCLVKYNYLNNVPYGIIFKSGTDDGKNMTFTAGGCAYNICKNGKFAVRMKGMNGVRVYNNTFYSDDAAGNYLLLITSNQDRIIPSPSIGSKVFNNIFYTTKQIPMISIESGSLTGFESDYNVFWCTNGEPIFAIDGKNYTWQQWKDLGYDTHSVIVDPKFINTTDLVPTERLDFGVDLGNEWRTGLSINAKWIPEIILSTANQNGKWQVGARIRETSSNPEPNNSTDFTIYPNPSSGNFQIKINEMPEDGVTVEIKNIHGQKLLEKKINSSITEWSVKQYPGNIFFITIKAININATKRIILK